MKIFQKITFLLTIFAASTATAQYTDIINSNRPGESQSAFSVGQTVFQAESGVFFNKENNAVTSTEANNFGVD